MASAMRFVSRANAFVTRQSAIVAIAVTDAPTAATSVEISEGSTPISPHFLQLPLPESSYSIKKLVDVHSEFVIWLLHCETHGVISIVLVCLRFMAMPARACVVGNVTAPREA